MYVAKSLCQFGSNAYQVEPKTKSKPRPSDRLNSREPELKLGLCPSHPQLTSCLFSSPEQRQSLADPADGEVSGLSHSQHIHRVYTVLLAFYGDSKNEAAI
jgi:hypothetical protein